MRHRLAASAAVTALTLDVAGCALPAPAEPTELGENVDDPTFGYEALVTTRDHQLISSRDVTLTEAEQQSGSGAWSAAKESGEKWPSPLVTEMTRVMENDRAMWRVTTCDTATNEFTTTLIP